MTKSKKKADIDPLYIAGVGASAGGLDALSKLLSVFNGSESAFCVVVVMHLSPDYKSELASILGKRCKWPVQTITTNLKIEARNVYVTPQNSDVHLEGDTLILDSLPQKYSSAPSIDSFLVSLAKSKGKNSIGIILSGYGHDGSKGVVAIREQRGYTIAQLPETAEHDDMPTSAIQTGKVDAVLPVEQMFDEVNQYIINVKAISQSRTGPKSVDAIFDLLEKRSGTDFSLYKPTTIMRRINHRMNNLQISSLTDYFTMIKNTPKELDVLFATVLIGVTQFFRDEKAFESLKKVLTTYLEDKNPGDSIRVWSVGCATGEEPYSIAILLHEILQSNISKFHIQIFASDIDEKALNIARQGMYRKDSLENMPEDFIDRYFEKRDGNHYQIKKSIKQYTLFTRHYISNDPPFVKLDMVVCRNLLIYFNNNLQKQSFQIFHYALRPKGLLFLGKSESVGVAADLFTKINPHKVFRKGEASLDYDLKFSRFKALTGRSKTDLHKSHRTNMSIVDVAKETLYYKFEHPFAIINEQAEIKEVNGSLRLYLEIGQGSMNASMYKMANREFVTVIKAVLSQVKKTAVPHVSHTIKFQVYDADHFVKIRIAPLIYPVNDVQYYIVIFEKVEPSEQILDLEKKLTTSDFVDLRIRELEDELEATREHLQIFTEELEANNEELQTINEELQSANEELKSSNEELETGNEELQSANEELNTANNELRLTNDMLIAKEKELQEEKEVSDRNETIYRAIAKNIPNGSVGILNEKFEIQYLDGRIFDDLGEDPSMSIGKSMPEMNPDPAEVKRLKKLCQETLLGKTGSIKVRYHDKFYSVQTSPIEIPHEDGFLILYLTQDITHETKDRIKLQNTLEATKLIVFEYNFRENVILPNKALSELLEIDKGEPISLSKIVEKVHPDDLKDASKIIKKSIKKGDIDFEIRLVLKGEVHYFRLMGRTLSGKGNEPEIGIASILNITDDKKLLHKVVENEERFKRIANVAPMFIWITNVVHECIFINDSWLEYTGSSQQESLGKGWLKYVHPEDVESAMNTYLVAADNKEKVTTQYRVRDKFNNYGWFLNIAKPYMGVNGEFQGYIGSVTNISEQKDFSEKLKELVADKTKELENSNKELLRMNMSLEEYAYVASHDLQEPVRKIQTFNSLLISKKENPADVEKYSGKIKQSADRMKILIRDILAYSKLTSSTVKMDTVDLDEILDEIRTDLELIMEEDNVSIEGNRLGKVYGMRTFMQQLFSNLIKNGIKYNTKEPIISIKAKNVLGKDIPKIFKPEPNREYKWLTFSDNGIGIEKGQFENIFKLFKRLHSKTDYAGTGIGLSICQRVVELHNGFIEVDSELGVGTTFNVYLPTKKSGSRNRKTSS